MSCKLVFKILLAVSVGVGSYLFGIIGVAVGLSILGFYSLNKGVIDSKIEKLSSIGGSGTVPPKDSSIWGSGTVPPKDSSIGGSGTVPPKK